MIQLWRRLRALQGGDRVLVAEAAIRLLAIWAGLRLGVVRFARLQRLAHASCPHLDKFSGRPDLRAPGRVGWAVTAVARRLPVSTTCLMQAAAGHAMLRRRGFISEIRLGVLPHRIGDATPLRGHAWVECDGDVIVGWLDDLSEYAVLSHAGNR